MAHRLEASVGPQDGRDVGCGAQGIITACPAQVLPGQGHVRARGRCRGEDAIDRVARGGGTGA